jgi:hypothetical protein
LTFLISAEAQRNCFCSLSPNGFIVGGEGWGEGETPRAVVTLPRVAAPPPHPTLSPKRGLEERALQLLNFDAKQESLLLSFVPFVFFVVQSFARTQGRRSPAWFC